MDSPPHLLCVSDLTCVALGELLDLAAHMKADITGFDHTLAREPLACFHDPPTTGAALAAAVAGDRLGMHPVMLPRRELQVGSGEPVRDIARMFSTTAAALVTHAVPHRVLRTVAAHATVPVVNGLSDLHFPSQALADLLTLRERFGTLEGLAIAFVGDARAPAAHSLLEAAALAGIDMRIACPPEYDPDRLVQVGAEALADRHGARLTITRDPREAVSGVHAVYTAPWVPLGREPEREIRLERLHRFHVHPELMRLARRDHVFMHCLPARRGEEAAALVLDGGRSVVWQQAGNRVHAQQAAIFALVRARRETTARNGTARRDDHAAARSSSAARSATSASTMIS
jgi:ornithine carbamoyltransferase